MNAKKWVVVVVSLFLMFGMGYIPPMFGLSARHGYFGYYQRTGLA